MPNMNDCVSHLAQEIGPRPAGTEEEQQAALYIEECFKKEIGFPVAVDEFEGATGNDLTRLICAGLSLVGALLFMLTSALAIPGLILALLAVVLFVADLMDKPLIARFLSKGVSQNVIAKYKPETSKTDARGRKRKIIVVTRYDSGKVRPELNKPFVKFYGIANKVSAGAIAFILLWLVIRSLFAMYPDGGVAVVLNVITVLAMVCAALPLILKGLSQSAAYNDGANSSAAGVAVMLDVAQRVADSSLIVPEFVYDEEDEPTVHGEEAAYEEGLIPEGADLAYEVEETLEAEAPAAFAQQETASFEPVSESAEPVVEPEPVVKQEEVAIETEPVAEPEPVVPVVAATAAVAEAAPAAAAAVAPVAAQMQPAADDNVPSWFKSAQAKAKKTAEPAPVQRSRYADALDAALQKIEAESVAEDDQIQAATYKPVAPIFATQEEPAEPVVEQVQVETRADYVAPEAECVVLPEARVADGEDVLSDVLTEDVAEIPTAPEVEMPAFLSGEMPVVTVAASEPEPEAEVEPEAEEPEPASSAAVTAVHAPVVLPDVVSSSLPSVDDLRQQRAPLADSAVAESQKDAAKGLLGMLPSINLKGEAAAEAKSRPSLVLPSLSGSLPVTQALDAPSGSAGMTGSFAPVADALATNVEQEEDLYIDDADDSEFEENFTENGAYAGPDYVDMPKSRFGGFFDRLFGRNKASEGRPSLNRSAAVQQDSFDVEPADQEAPAWDDEESFDGWDEGSTQEFKSIPFDEAADDASEQGQDRRWEGGAFSGLKDKVAGAASGAKSGAAGALGKAKDKLPFGKDADGAVDGQPEAGEAASEERPARARRARRSEGQEQAERPARIRGSYHSEFADLGLNLTPETYEEEQKAIEQFQNPSIQTEVWFVALGSDLDGNAGMRAFLDANASEMRGAIIIELDSVGSGELTMLTEEGSLRPVKTSSRMKRFIRKANQSLGMLVGTDKLDWSDSASSYANSHGCQAMHLVGMDNGKPALFAEADDVTENIKQDKLDQASDYVMELIRNI